MNPALYAALAECDELSIALRLAEGDRIVFRTGPAGFPDRLRDTLRSHRPALLDWLRLHPRPDPDPVTFVAPNLDVMAVPFAGCHSTAVVLVGGRPFYALTPSVFVLLISAADRKYCRGDGTYRVTDPDYPAAHAALLRLGAWVDAHYRPDQIERAWRKPLPLPVPERVPA